MINKSSLGVSIIFNVKGSQRVKKIGNCWSTVTMVTMVYSKGLLVLSGIVETQGGSYPT